MVDVSVVITTKDEESNIGSCLDSVYNQSYPPDKIEVILVDNNSTDNTRAVAAKFGCRLYTHGPERSAQRNFAAQKARGEYILFLDADMLLSRDVVSQCLGKCADDKLVALYIPEKIIGRGFWIKVRDFERSFYNSTVIDCVRFIHRAEFLQAEGFDERLTGPEDWDFDRRIKDYGKVGIIDSWICHNEGDFNLRKYIGKKLYYAGSFNRYIKKWGSSDTVIRKQFGLLYRYLFVFLEQGKWKKMIFHPFLVLGMYALRSVLGCAFIFRRSFLK
jgi:glycosyltransferase involved in cell wall biosynthesis